MAQYTYQLLHGVLDIRLLRLLPATDNEPLSCEIVTASLTSDIPFTALSYVWGSDVRCFTVKTSQGFIRITASLNAALRSLRSQTQSRLIWADAVSINQSSNTEKSHQVSLMGRIYGAASNVVAYLGPESDGSHLIPALLRKLAQAELGQMIDQSFRPGQKGLPPDSDPSWVALRAFLRRPWFRRVWILQESVVNPEIYLTCGNWTERADLLMEVGRKAMNVMVHVNHMLPNFGQDGPEFKSCFQLRAMNLARKMISDGQVLKLQDVLSNFGRADATKARDHLFGLLSLASERNDPALYPDYEEPLESVWRRYTFFMIRHYNSLDVLSLAGLPSSPTQNTSRFSSWTPDFTVSRVEKMSLVQRTGHSTFRAGASGTAITVRRDMSSPDTLFITGTFADTLEYVGHEVTQADDSYDNTLLPLEFQRLINTLSIYPTGEPLASVERRTLTGDLQGHESAWQRLKECLKLDMPYRLREYKEIIGDEAVFSTAIDKLTVNRKCASTSNGYVGFVPESARPDDLVFLPSGGKVPLILRAGEGTFSLRLVGDAYVHGIMYGELWQLGMLREMEVRVY